jgi:Zn-finger protein
LTYQSWHQDHAKKHQKILEKLSHLSDDEIIEYFRFSNMVKAEPDFCLLYKENKQCHEMEDLNCYLCACPNFRVGENKSYCSIDSKDGGSIKAPDGFIHQDCSKCTVPHTKEYIKKHFSRDWLKIMWKNFEK